MPSLLGLVDSLENNVPVSAPHEKTRIEGFDAHRRLLGMEVEPSADRREEALLDYEMEFEKRVAYRWKNWKLIKGYAGDGKQPFPLHRSVTLI